MRAPITTEMKAQASVEAKQRDAYIKHHFEVKHLTHSERDELGFLGEFACCTLLGIDWKRNIRDNYYTIDNYDVVINGKKSDVKTETVPTSYAKKIISRTINDDDLYGRRLVNQGQYNLLNKYDIIIFGLIVRNNLDYWYPIGFIETSIIINNYPPTTKRPDGGHYPFAASPVPTSILKPFSDLIRNF
jgi:hypothetical protein